MFVLEPLQVPSLRLWQSVSALFTSDLSTHHPVTPLIFFVFIHFDSKNGKDVLDVTLDTSAK
jgi:hypothetical protein